MEVALLKIDQAKKTAPVNAINVSKNVANILFATPKMKILKGSEVLLRKLLK